MKVVAFILSIIIFSQSLSVCSPSIGRNYKSDIQKSCKMDFSDKSSSPKKSCCSKKTEKKSDHKDKDDCCGDNCQCLTCIKVFLNTSDQASIRGILNAIKTEDTIEPVLVNSHDFHPTITYPPNV